MKICCISAKARHGKDTAAELIKEHLEAQGQRVLITHFADLLKYICKQIFNKRISKSLFTAHYIESNKY